MATNLLATGVVLIAGLTLGRYVIRTLWTDSSKSPGHVSQVVGPTSGMGDETLLHTLQFGNSDSVFYCQTISGDYNKVTKALRKRTTAITKTTAPGNHPSTPAEEKWLATTAQLDPVASDGAAWQVFEKDGPVPVTVGIRTIHGDSQADADQNVAESKSRVVCWSIALPSLADAAKTDAAGDRWALFTFVPGHNSGISVSDKPVNVHPSFPLPAKATRTLSLRAPGGASILGFKGAIHPDQVKRHFDELARERQWQSNHSWQIPSDTHTRLFQSQQQQTIHVTFTRQNNDSIQGLVMFVPATNIEEQLP